MVDEDARFKYDGDWPWEQGIVPEMYGFDENSNTNKSMSVGVYGNSYLSFVN